ncbi:hypothetical protein CAPTEDRAFT_156122 [Capitella teleta]|uniref:GH10 domain-containing protein n=1 Tax=Capitella teleta TaxID=283909 RepID=R7V0A8_CAPTE|nr:hypothetical protein CAPTEDRAFT_156122 [Capitella teleta]|eukprot:ELU09096.1 hypothetical protein CAPTEDRAFT_156122 [Capitella teleta]
MKDAGMSELIPNDNWKEEANLRIERIRKGDINIHVTIGKKFDPSKVVVTVEQKSHSFPLGSCVAASKFTSDDVQGAAYREFFFENFNWATLENAMKWRFMEPVQGRVEYATVDKAIEALKAKGVSIRGHCVTWAKDKKISPWLGKLDRYATEAAVQSRIQSLVPKYKDVISQWDVCNEQLHGGYYENKTGEADYMDKMFQKVREADPNTPLCLNDYDVCSRGTFTTAYARQAKYLVERGVPVDFLGIQSHMSVYPDPDLLTKRLEVLAEAGVPLFITELDHRNADLELRGQGYEDIMRLYFSHPNIHGIVLWGFWDQAMDTVNSALAEGKDHIEWNEAGKKVEELWKREWTTCKKVKPEGPEDILRIRGFYGNYHMTLLYDGEEQWTHDFTLQKNKDVKIEVKI